jgi:hypothetical protein
VHGNPNLTRLGAFAGVRLGVTRGLLADRAQQLVGFINRHLALREQLEDAAGFNIYDAFSRF